jgi:hypothetical protein
MIGLELDQGISVGTDVLENEHDIVPFVDIELLIGVKVALFFLFQLSFFNQLPCINRLSDLNSIIPVNIQQILFL